MPFFPNRNIEIWKCDNDDRDVYGQPNYELIGEYEADVQVMDERKQEEVFGKVLTDVYTIFFDIDVPLEDTSVLWWDNKSYNIVGSVQVNDHVIPHKQVTVQITRHPSFRGKLYEKS